MIADIEYEKLEQTLENAERWRNHLCDAAHHKPGDLQPHKQIWWMLIVDDAEARVIRARQAIGLPN
jgi:hypothetical protein